MTASEPEHGWRVSVFTEPPHGTDALGEMARWLVLGATTIGALALLRWALDIPLGLDPWLTNTKPSTALCLVLLGAAFLLKRPWEGRVRARELSLLGVIALVELIVTLSLLESFGELDFGIDAYVPSHGLPRRTRMSPVSAVNLALLGLAVGMLHARKRALPIGLAALPLFLSLTALVGYLYGARPDAHALSLPPMVALSALGIALLSAGIICTRLLPATGSLLSGSDPSAVATRRQLLGLVAIPIALGAFELLLRRRALYDLEFGVALLTVANVLLLISLSLWSTHVTLRAQRRQAQLERDLAQKEATLEAETRMQHERARSPQALARSAEKFRTLALHAPVGIFEASPSGECVFVNHKWMELTELTMAEALGYGWAASIHPDDRERVTREWAAITDRGQPFSTDYRFLAKSGKVSWVEGSSVPLRDADGTLTDYLGTLVDVTERKRAMDALEKSERNFRALVERAPFGVMVLRAGKIVYVNAEQARMLGYEEGELAGKEVLSTLVHPAARALTLERLRALEAGSVLPPLPVTCLRKDGSELVVEGTTSSIVFDGQDAQVAVVRDVTEQQHTEQVRLLAERALRESLREKEVLLKEMQHRVKNNLQVIVSLVNLQASKVADEATREAFEETRARVHAIALLHERLYRSKNIGRIDMRDYLRGLANDLSSTAQLSHIEVGVDAEEVYWEMDSAVPIGLVVNELVTNSFKHAFGGAGRENGRIEIALTRFQGECTVTVRDNGSGYPSDFDVDSHDTLGLLLITSLSRQLGGNVVFTSEGGGARAIVRFPDPAREAPRTGALRTA